MYVCICTGVTEQQVRDAAEAGCRTVAFPSISTGVYGYPADLAAPLAVDTVATFAARRVREVVFCCFSTNDLERYRALLP